MDEGTKEFHISKPVEDHDLEPIQESEVVEESLSIQDKDVTDIKSFEKVMKALYTEQPKIIKLFVRRSFRTAFVFIEPDWKKFEGDEK